MTPEFLFGLAGPAAMLGWVALALMPVSPLWTMRVAWTVVIAQGVLYAALIAVYFAGAEGGYDTLDNVMLLFTNPGVALAGWVHYLSFDLFVGAWIAQQARTDGVHHVFVLPCLFLTLMFGPIGLLLYLAIRMAYSLRTETA